jgi:epoxyqueuosine reductase
MESTAGKKEITDSIKKLFSEEGFFKTGMSSVQKLETEAEYFGNWLKEGRNADMEWLGRNFETRTNPQRISNKFKSVISSAYIYDTPFEHSDNRGIAKITRYAWGLADYHKILKKKLKKICWEIEKLREGIKTKYYVDDGPVLEKIWAVKSGIGWQGKNTTVINQEYGSFFFLVVVFINAELEYDRPIENLCEGCTICRNACPTGALYDEYKLDANLCIAYHTIESKKEIPDYIDVNGWIFGCDICQDVCPYNKRKFFTEDRNFYPLEKVFEKTFEELDKISEEQFNEIFISSPIKRTKFSGWKRNIQKAIIPR